MIGQKKQREKKFNLKIKSHNEQREKNPRRGSLPTL